MYTNIPIVFLDDTLHQANLVMNESFMDEALVVSNATSNKVIGIITSSDLVLAFNKKLSELNFGNQEETDTNPSDGNVLKALNLNRLVEKDLITVAPENSLREIVNAIIKSKRNIFPVVDTEQNLCGVILLNEIRSIMFDQSQYDLLTAKEIMTQPPEIVKITDSMQKVIYKFETTKAWNLPVTNDKNQYIGLVSKSSIFSQYRKELVKYAIY